MIVVLGVTGVVLVVLVLWRCSGAVGSGGNGFGRDSGSNGFVVVVVVEGWWWW